MSIKLITFKTNHTIMGDVEISGDYYVVRQPVQVVSVPPRSAEDPGSIAFSPFVEYSQEFKSGIKINVADVLFVTTPILELENQYNSIFGSGIQIAPASALKR